jgi:hypothetical protein
MSDKAPEKLYYDYVNNEITRVEANFSHVYIREDLVPVKVEPLLVDEEQRRREMYEKVALVILGKDGSGFNIDDIHYAHFITDVIIKEADKCAKGEK